MTGKPVRASQGSVEPGGPIELGDGAVVKYAWREAGGKNHHPRDDRTGREQDQAESPGTAQDWTQRGRQAGGCRHREGIPCDTPVRSGHAARPIATGGVRTDGLACG